MPTDDDLTTEDKELLNDLLSGSGIPKGDEKHNAHTFLNNVAKSDDTTKTGCLSDEELGFTKYSERTYKNLELVSDELCDDDLWKSYFKKKGEILTATSLSKQGFLTSLAVIQKKQIEDVTKYPERKENKGWFRKKEPQQEVTQ